MALLEGKPRTSSTSIFFFVLLITSSTSIGGSTSIGTSVFEQGNYKPSTLTLEPSRNSTPSAPPKQLLITTPTTKGTYTVILFLHGFILHNSFYSQLLLHISSHGYIVVAPQLYLLPTTGSVDEINDAARVKDWLPQGLQSHLPQDVEANLEAIALVGHSRGGKTAFSLALGYGQTTLTTTPPKYSVVVGIDPVGGMSRYRQTEPKILTFVPESFNISIPVAVIGTGLGPQKANWFAQPCAPDGVNDKEFFNESKPPRCHFVAKDYGHLDMLDDSAGWLRLLEDSVCKGEGGSRDPMRRFVGGIVVAFLKAYVAGESEDLDAIVNNPHLAPVKLEPLPLLCSTKLESHFQA